MLSSYHNRAFLILDPDYLQASAEKTVSSSHRHTGRDCRYPEHKDVIREEFDDIHVLWTPAFPPYKCRFLKKALKNMVLE